MESVLDLNSFDQKVISGELRLIHRGRSSRLYLGSDKHGAQLVFKEYYPRNRWDIFKQQLFGSRAKRAAFAAASLARNGFSVLQVEGVIDEALFLKSNRSILITKFETNAIALKKAIPAITSKIERRMLLRLLAKDVAKMHQLGRAHDDMNLGNILLCNSIEGYQLIWSDIDRVKISPLRSFGLSSNQVFNNLRQLAKLDVGLSPKEMLYFFYSYTSLRSVKRSGAKKLLVHLIQEFKKKGLR